MKGHLLFAGPVFCAFASRVQYLGVAEFWAGLFIQLQKPVPTEKDQLIGKAARLCLLAYETQRQREEGGKGWITYKLGGGGREGGCGDIIYWGK